MSIYKKVSQQIKLEANLPVPQAGKRKLMDWLSDEAPQPAEWLLAHCYAGVVWGKYQEDEWLLSTKITPDLSPALTWSSFLQVRVFGENGELLLWRDGDQLRARKVIVHKEGKEYEGYLEDQWLWGTRAEKKVIDGFTWLTDGAQGLQHVVPIEVPQTDFATDRSNYRPVRLRVMNYLRANESSGLAEVWLSRLVKVFSEPPKEEV